MMKNTYTNEHDFEAIKQRAYREARKILSAASEHELCEDIAQDVLVAILSQNVAAISSPLGFAGSLARQMAYTHLRRKYSHDRYLQRGDIPEEMNSEGDPAQSSASLEQKEQLRQTLMNLEPIDTLHLLAVSLNIPAREFHSAFYKDANKSHSLATVYSHRHKAIERARNSLA